MRRSVASINPRGDDGPGRSVAAIDRRAMLQDSGALHRHGPGRTGGVADLLALANERRKRR